jgi:hypothetical protein
VCDFEGGGVLTQPCHLRAFIHRLQMGMKVVTTAHRLSCMHAVPCAVCHCLCLREAVLCCPQTLPCLKCCHREAAWCVIALQAACRVEP